MSTETKEGRMDNAARLAQALAYIKELEIERNTARLIGSIRRRTHSPGDNRCEWRPRALDVCVTVCAACDALFGNYIFDSPIIPG